MDYRIVQKENGKFVVEQKLVTAKRLWLKKTAVETWELAVFPNPVFIYGKHPVAFYPPLPPYSKWYDAAAALYKISGGCSQVKIDVDCSGRTTWYYNSNQ